jgi:hypothetical protein
MREQPDLLYGVRAIGRHLGLTKGQARQACRTGAVPHFFLDGVMCARRSSIGQHFDRLELVEAFGRDNREAVEREAKRVLSELRDFLAGVQHSADFKFFTHVRQG